uniref:Uncharacterized protein n=1 Tax=Candidatus Kentrum sp. MB TaxID=2138164 RepID=A0A451BDM8_9GAMM|nr:MAG: hypothetical protein BECKMB1821G_GA0114241_10171 [Candidatus Kentron sp. MB]VFK33808.1 MAG: hypothetical protein BECKMB1821I_GA0114274_105331 [Candidatus Kentron sp. MB]VFK76396.1 MAG: hypothetical protein BECKMB1821H_GA0114242_105431 [Candidatus Kentron sp. MB]
MQKVPMAILAGNLRIDRFTFCKEEYQYLIYEVKDPSKGETQNPSP